MAHRQTDDAWTIRPSHDDRRNSDGPGRRRPSYGRSDSSYRERERERERDRERDRGRDRERGRGRDDRERDRDRDRNRDRESERRDISSSPRGDKDSSRAKAMSTTSANSDLGVGRVRQEQHGSTGSSPMSPALAIKSDGSNATEAISKVFISYIKDISEYTRLQVHRENLEKAVKIRDVEYKKAALQTADFPSVPELHKKLFTRDKSQLAGLDEKARKHHHRAVETATQMAQLLVAGLPLAEMNKSNAGAGLDAFRDEFKEMKVKFANLEEASAQQQAALQGQLKDLQAQLSRDKDEKEALQSRVKNQETEFGKLQAAYTTELSGLQTQVSTLQTQLADADKARQAKEQENANEIAKLAAYNTMLLAKNTELETQVGILQTDRDDLQSRLSDLAARFAPLPGVVEAIQQESSSKAQVLVDLKAGLDSSTQQCLQMGQKLANHDERLDQQDTKLSEIDVTVLDEISQNWTFEWPNMKKAIQTIQEELAHTEPEKPPMPPSTDTGTISQQAREELLAEVSSNVMQKVKEMTNGSSREDLLAEVSSNVMQKVEQITNNSFDMVGQMIEKLEGTVKTTRKEVGEISERVKILEDLTLDERLKALELESNSERPKMLEGKVEKLEGNLELTKILEGRIEKLENDSQNSVAEFAGKTEALTLQLDVLNSMYSNITTTEVAEHIIGVLRQMPATHDLAQDMKALDDKVQNLQKQLHGLSASPIYKNRVGKEFDGIDELEADWQGKSNKRRRVESTTNDVHAITNTGG